MIPCKIATAASFFILLSVLVACGVQNNNSAHCLAADCMSSCQQMGFSGGVCSEDICICDQSTDTYDWDAGDTDTDTDTDTDSDTDTDTDTDTDADGGPDGSTGKGRS